MKRISHLAAVTLILAVQTALPADTPKTGHTVRLNGHNFTLPDGFEIDLVAGPPLVDRPIVADFDEQGRLYVADSSGSNDKVAVQLEKKPHRILRLESTKGDGKYDKATVFADQMMFPEGVMWFAGSLYVAAPPSIWKLTDTTGSGKAERREEWFKGKTLTGCANDLHGPYRGPDGWIYWCKGAFARQTYERPGKKPFTTRASHIFRCRPDGSGLEAVMTGGMDNPVDVVFTPGGERIFTTTFFQHPAAGRRDGLIHAVYGAVYGKDHDVVYEHPWTAPTLMPPMTHLGPASLCGLHRYESPAFGLEYENNLFACLFNLRKVTRHVLIPDGATFRTEDSDFLVSDSHDFHPTDVLEDADGSLLVIDTGGWYKICCPTSQLVKPDVLGAIYRIRKKSPLKAVDLGSRMIDWDKEDAESLSRRLDDLRPMVRRRALEKLGTLGAEAVPPLVRMLRKGSMDARRNAVWAATRIDHASARKAVRAALADTDETVRQAALHSVSLWRDREAVPALLGLLKHESAHNRRAAAEALGRIRDGSAVPALLEVTGKKNDRVLEHSLTYALLEIADRERTAEGLKSSNPLVRRAALMALDQMEGGQLAAAEVVRDLMSADPALKETAAWIVGRHPEWGREPTGHFRAGLMARDLSPAGQDALADQLGKLARSEAIQQLLAEAVQTPKGPFEARIAVKAMARAGLKTVCDAWAPALTAALQSSDSQLVREAATTARAWPAFKAPPPDLVAALQTVGGNARLPEAVRLTALAALPANLPFADERMAFLLAHLDRDQPVALRSPAADALARASLTAEQLIQVARALKSTGPMEVNKLLDSYTKSTEERVGLALVIALSAPEARAGLRSDAVKQRLAKYGPEVHKEAAKLYALLDADFAQQRATLEKMLTDLPAGDIRRGQAIFNSTKTACASCHKIGYVGGLVGPDLTRIGGIRAKRDLLEAIVFPSASFVRSYEPVVVVTKAGKTFSGVVRKDAPDEVVVAVAADREERIAREDIDEMRPGEVSLMPAGLEKQMTLQEFADLVAFLMACK